MNSLHRFMFSNAFDIFIWPYFQKKSFLQRSQALNGYSCKFGAVHIAPSRSVDFLVDCVLSLTLSRAVCYPISVTFCSDSFVFLNHDLRLGIQVLASHIMYASTTH